MVGVSCLAHPAHWAPKREVLSTGEKMIEEVLQLSIEPEIRRKGLAAAL
jgi:hypothetical protein